jgi:hypothetical protein
MIFQGDNEYLEDFIARIDAPRLNPLNIFLFDQLVFYIPNLLWFINYTGMTKSYNQAAVVFNGVDVTFSHHPPEGTNASRPPQVRNLRQGDRLAGLTYGTDMQPVLFFPAQR